MFAEKPKAVSTNGEGDTTPNATPVSDAPAGAPPVPPRHERSPDREGAGRYRAVLWFLLVLLVGTLCRTALSVRPGHLPDVDLFAAWMRGLVDHGLGEFYDHGGANYPPVYILVLRSLGWVLSHFNEQLSDAFVRPWLRAPSCLADILIAFVLFIEVRRLYSSRAAVVAASLYFLNPVSLYISAYWGQVDSIHTLFLLGALVAVNRLRPGWAGFATGLALLQKLQSVAFVPLLIFDIYRWKRWRGVGLFLAGAVVAGALVMTPFMVRGSAPQALRHGYGVVGQYPQLSINAFNLWHIGNRQKTGDTAPPGLLIRAAAAGASRVEDDATWYLHLTWRRIGSLLFILTTAAVLSLYARRHTPDARALAAAGLGLAFFLFLTEMHERYAYPVIAILPIWAVVSTWRERAFVILCAMLLLNLTLPQSVDQIAGDIGATKVILFVGLCAYLAFARDTTAGPSPPKATVTPPPVAPPEPSRLVRAFRGGTLIAWIAAVGIAGTLIWIGVTAPDLETEDALYLSDLEPAVARQGYGQLARDAEVEGGPIHVGEHYYLRGLGTHASATIVYEIPPGYRRFEAVVGVNRAFNGQAKVVVRLDNKTVSREEAFTRESDPLKLSIQLGQAKRLTLRVEPAGSNKGDHVDWADARLVR